MSIAEVDLNGEHVVRTVDPGAHELRLTVVLPAYFQFVPDRHHHLHVSSSDEGVVNVPPFEIEDPGFDWRLPLEVGSVGDAVLRLEGQVFFCPVSDATRCLWATVDESFRVRVEPGGSPVLELVHDIDLLECLERGVAARPAADEN